MSQSARILDVLSDGRHHSVAEIHRRAGTSRLNSRVAELRSKGYEIECSTIQATQHTERYLYRLLSSSPKKVAAHMAGPPPPTCTGGPAQQRQLGIFGEWDDAA